MAVNVKEAIAVLARLMIEHKIEANGEIHLAYTQAVRSIESFGSALSHHVEETAVRDGR